MDLKSNELIEAVDTLVIGAVNNRLEGAFGNHFGNGCYVSAEVGKDHDGIRLYSEKRDAEHHILAISSEVYLPSYKYRSGVIAIVRALIIELYPELDMAMDLDSDEFYEKVDESVIAAVYNRKQGAVLGELWQGCGLFFKVGKNRDHIAIHCEKTDINGHVLATSSEVRVDSFKSRDLVISAIRFVVTELYPELRVVNNDD
jgi:hypothetical protein